MGGTGGCDACGGTSGAGCNASGVIEIVQGYDKSFYVELFYLETQLPYDLTGATQITATFPGDPVVTLSYSAAEIVVAGSPGAGRIQILVDQTDSAAMAENPNPSQPQDLQIVVTNLDTTKTVFVIPTVLDIVAPPYGVI